MEKSRLNGTGILSVPNHTIYDVMRDSALEQQPLTDRRKQRELWTHSLGEGLRELRANRRRCVLGQRWRHSNTGRTADSSLITASLIWDS